MLLRLHRFEQQSAADEHAEPLASGWETGSSGSFGKPGSSRDRTTGRSRRSWWKPGALFPLRSIARSKEPPRRPSSSSRRGAVAVRLRSSSQSRRSGCRSRRCSAPRSSRSGSRFMTGGGGDATDPRHEAGERHQDIPRTGGDDEAGIPRGHGRCRKSLAHRVQEQRGRILTPV